jgi:catechol 2,3-dioxygenase-like lactoylglutathione lyase family enzyme
VKLSAITYLVRDYDEAIRWFVDVLGFELRQDENLADDKRWVLVAPKGAETSFLLAKASDANQLGGIGKAAGGRVAFFLNVDDFDATYAALRKRGVQFCETPRREPYGMVAVFEDIYQNRWDLLGPVPQRNKS